MEKTVTEIAFEKAHEFDIILGYIGERNLNHCGVFPDCSNLLRARYNLPLYSDIGWVLNILQEYFDSKEKPIPRTESEIVREETYLT